MNRTVQLILPYQTATSLDLKTRLDRHKQGICVSTEDAVPLFLFITWEIKVREIFTTIIPLFCSCYRLRGTQQ